MPQEETLGWWCRWRGVTGRSLAGERRVEATATAVPLCTVTGEAVFEYAVAVEVSAGAAVAAAGAVAAVGAAGDVNVVGVGVEGEAVFL